VIADLQPYPAYKDSGVPWLGDVPAHWRLERAKWLFRKMERPVRGDDQVVTCFRDGTVTLRKNRRTRGFTESLKEIGYQGIRRGDLVIHAMDAFAGAVGVADSDGKGTPVYSVCQPEPDVNAHFYAFLVREMARSQWIAALAKGIRERSTDFRFEGFASQVVPLPPLPEQTAIVRYLDYVDRRIRRYIRTKQKLIALLNEQKQAIIHQAVTRGLDPNIRLKSSGIEWLGDVPEHWEVRRLKFLAHIKTGGRDTVHRKDDGAYPFFVRSQTVERIDSYSFDGEAVLTAGDGAGVAKVFHYINGKFDYHQRVYKFSSFRKVHGRFFFYYFSCTLRFEAFRETAKSTVDSLRLPMLQNFPVPLPPIEEQDEIVMAVERQTQELDRSLATVRREISLLREYRTRLIADVVTGKLDVCAAAAALPEEGEAPEVLEETPDEAEEGEDPIPEDEEIET
jgi:type I restriction enzyme S subunit